ncbi:hypothetical protein, partial [Aeromonas hydrophila]|uniref:hypothetical protein n=1 Tax=Aeromonas hydrophila TaxID=644 RepID=UPI0029DD29B8
RLRAPFLLRTIRRSRRWWGESLAGADDGFGPMGRRSGRYPGRPSLPLICIKFAAARLSYGQSDVEGM